MINRDPLGEICEDILNVGTYGARIIEIRLWYIGKRAKLTSAGILSKIVYRAKIVWSYIEEQLILWRILPYPTKEEVAASYERLRLSIADTQYDDDPRVIASKKNAQAVLDEYDKRKGTTPL